MKVELDNFGINNEFEHSVNKEDTEIRIQKDKEPLILQNTLNERKDSCELSQKHSISKFQFPKRIQVLILLWWSEILSFMDRTNIAIAIIPMSEEFQWNQPTKGIVLSSFFVGYFTTQILGGYLATRYGGKTILGIGVFLLFFLLLQHIYFGY